MDQVGKFYRDAKEAYRSKICLRHEEIIDAASEVENNILTNFGRETFDLVVADERLDSALESYFYEIHRYKSFHGMLDKGKLSNINFPKIYAFTAKWILKEKPFYIFINLEKLHQDTALKEELVFISDRINELIVLSWIQFSHKKHTAEEIHFDDDETKKLIYNFKFREFSTGMLELMLDKKVCHEKLKQQKAVNDSNI